MKKIYGLAMVVILSGATFFNSSIAVANSLNDQVEVTEETTDTVQDPTETSLEVTPTEESSIQEVEGQDSTVETLQEPEVETTSSTVDVTVKENSMSKSGKSFAPLLAEGELAIDEINFPDPVFRQYVKDTFSGGGDSLAPTQLANVRSISISNMGISSLKGIEYFPNLNELSASTNKLTSVDISQNTQLTSLSLIGNLLTEIDITQNTKLNLLQLNSNQLAQLDTSNNPLLVTLSFGNNKLTTFNSSGNPELKSLDASANQLATADVSASTKLESLNLSSNRLTQLDLQSNTNLVSLRINNNKLSQLSLSTYPVLTNFVASTNLLTTLDLSRFTALKNLEVNSNKFTELDLSNNKALVTAAANGNLLTSVTLNGNSALTSLSVEMNKLTTIDLTEAPALQTFYSTQNLLSQINVTANKALQTLSLTNNQLGQIDLTGNTALTYLVLENNKLTEIDVTKNTKLTTFNISRNNIETLDVSKNTALRTIFVRTTNLTSLYLGNNTALASSQLVPQSHSAIMTYRMGAWEIDLKQFPGVDPTMVTALSSGWSYDVSTGLARTNLASPTTFSYNYDTSNAGRVMQVDLTVVPSNGKEVTVAYQDTKGNDLLPNKVLVGLAGSPWAVEPESIPNYQLKETEGNVEGVFNENEQQVTFVYEKIPGGDVTVSYEDESGNELQESVVLKGRLDESWNAPEATIEKYTLKSVEGERSGVFNEKEQQVTFVYEKKPGGDVTVSYEDESGNELQESVVLKGKLDESWNAPEATIEKYTLKSVEGERSGVFNENEQQVTFVYEKKPGADVTVSYEDESGNELQESVVLKGRLDESWNAPEATIEGYTLKSVEGELSGVFNETAKTVTFVYEKNLVEGAEITVLYQDEAGKELHPATVLKGMIGEEWEANPVFVEGYFVKTTLGATSGSFDETSRTVTFVYESIGRIGYTVIVMYQDEEGNMLADGEFLEGSLGDSWKAEEKQIEGYRFSRVEGETSGFFVNQMQVVTFFYEKIVKKGEDVIVSYRDESGKELQPNKVLQGAVGDTWQTDAADIKGYELVKVEGDLIGTFTEQSQQVIFTYKKIATLDNKEETKTDSKEETKSDEKKEGRKFAATQASELAKSVNNTGKDEMIPLLGENSSILMMFGVGLVGLLGYLLRKKIVK